MKYTEKDVLSYIMGKMDVVDAAIIDMELLTDQELREKVVSFKALLEIAKMKEPETLRVLVIDDSTIERKAIIGTLEAKVKAKMEINDCRTPTEFEALVYQNYYDIVVMDIDLHKVDFNIDGITLFKKVRQNLITNGKSIPKPVFITNSSHQGEYNKRLASLDLKKAYDKDAIDREEKPFFDFIEEFVA